MKINLLKMAKIVALHEGSNRIIQQINERERAPGILRPGCPCCDPDDSSNILYKIMMLKTHNILYHKIR